MKFSKVVEGVVLTKPMGPREVMTALRLTVHRRIKPDELVALFSENNYMLVPIGPAPVVPEELLGRCIVSLGVPTIDANGGLTRTYEFAEATPEQLEVASNAIRSKRDKLLILNVDGVNAIRWSTMSAEKMAEWTAYRQALLDLPDQPGFPMNVSWPVKPA